MLVSLYGGMACGGRCAIQLRLRAKRAFSGSSQAAGLWSALHVLRWHESCSEHKVDVFCDTGSQLQHWSLNPNYGDHNSPSPSLSTETALHLHGLHVRGRLFGASSSSQLLLPTLVGPRLALRLAALNALCWRTSQPWPSLAVPMSR